MFTVHLARFLLTERPERHGFGRFWEGVDRVSQEDHSGKRPRRSSRHAFRSIGDEGGLLVDSDESKVHVLNPVGSRIYELLDGAHSTEEIVRAVVAEFEISEEQARQDLQLFLRQLEETRTLESVGSAAHSEGSDE